MYYLVLFLLMLSWGCSHSSSSIYMSDDEDNWIVAQYNIEGDLLLCWELHHAGVVRSDDYVVFTSNSGHHVQAASPYNAVSVDNSRWESAFALLHINRDDCQVPDV